MRHRIAYANPWVLRVDGAKRGVASYVALGVAVAAVVFTMTGGVALYEASAGLRLGPALDRATQYFCIEGPLYLVALGGLFYEQRAKIAANTGPLSATGVGGGLGFAGYGLAVAVTAILGGLRPDAVAAAPLVHRLDGMLIGAVLIAFQAMGEELFFRGWLQPRLAAPWGPRVGVIVTSILFGAAHALGGRHLGVLALANDSLAGLVFGLLAFRSGGLIAPFAAHFAWNWTEQSLLGLTPNPGVDPLGSLFDLDLVGPGWLTGGVDEMNGAIAATLALAAMTAVTLVWRPGRGGANIQG